MVQQPVSNNNYAQGNCLHICADQVSNDYLIRVLRQVKTQLCSCEQSLVDFVCQSIAQCLYFIKELKDPLVCSVFFVYCMH